MNAGLLGLVGAPTYPMLRDFTERVFFEVFDANEIPYDFHKQGHILTLTDLGSEIIFRSLEEPERLRGTNLAWFGVDELTYCKEDAWLRLEARLRHPHARELCGYGVWTPKGYDWVYRKFISAEAPAGYQAILATPRENTALPSDYYDKLADSYDVRFAQQELEGKYINSAMGLAYYSFDRATHLKPQKYNPALPICWALDFNLTPMCSVICQVEEKPTRSGFDTIQMQVYAETHREIHVLDEIYLNDSNVEEACAVFFNKLQAIAPDKRMKVFVYADASGKNAQHVNSGPRSALENIRQYFGYQRQHDMTPRWKKENPLIRDRVAAVNAALRNIRGDVRLQIDPRCKHLVMDLESVCWKEGIAKLDDKAGETPTHRVTHISDALGYLIETEMPLRQSSGWKSERII